MTILRRNLRRAKATGARHRGCLHPSEYTLETTDGDEHDQHRITEADRPSRGQCTRCNRPRERNGRAPWRQDGRAVGNEGRLRRERARLCEAESVDGARPRDCGVLSLRQDLELTLKAWR